MLFNCEEAPGIEASNSCPLMIAQIKGMWMLGVN